MFADTVVILGSQLCLTSNPTVDIILVYSLGGGRGRGGAIAQKSETYLYGWFWTYSFLYVSYAKLVRTVQFVIDV